jgi:hypothetical protein
MSGHDEAHNEWRLNLRVQQCVDLARQYEVNVWVNPDGPFVAEFQDVLSGATVRLVGHGHRVHVVVRDLPQQMGALGARRIGALLSAVGSLAVRMEDGTDYGGTHAEAVEAMSRGAGEHSERG